MKYQLTKQYAKGKELPLAELNEWFDVELFVNAKVLADTNKNLKLIYRVFENGKLLDEFNKEKLTIPISRAQYAEGDLDIPQRFASPFNVLKKANSETILIGKFCNIEDAKIFIEAKLLSENNTGISYVILNGQQYVEKIDRAQIDLKNSQSSQGKEKKVAFRPTPLPMTLRLGPPKWLVDEDENDDSDEEKK